LTAAAAASYCAIQFGGGNPFDLHASLLLLGAGAIAVMLTWVPDHPVFHERVTVWVALLFPAYVALQLIPIPTPILGLLDPARAAIAGSLGLVGAAPSSASITIAADKTWMHLPRVVGYTLTFLMAWQAARRFQRWPWAVAVPLIALGAGEAFVGLAQAAAGAKVSGTYGNKNHFAGLLEMTLPLALMIVVSAWRRAWPPRHRALELITMIGAGVAAIAMFAAIPLSLSRAGFLSMLGSLAVMTGVGLLPRATRWQRAGMIAAAPALALLALATLPTDNFIDSLGSLKNGDGRWPVILDSLRMFSDFPLFGIGLGTYYPGFLPYQTTTLDATWTSAHNDYLQYLNELGLMGVVFPAVVVGMVLHRAYRTTQREPGADSGFVALGCLGGLSAMLFHSTADFNMYVPANAMVFMFIAGIAMGTGGSAQPSGVEAVTGGRGWALRATCAALCAWLVFNSLAWLAFLQRYEADPGVETAFCRIGVCNYYATLAAAKSRYDDIAARMPPEELIALLPRDPAGGYNWIDLGESLEAHGRLDVANASFARGIELGPNIPYFLMRAAGFQLRQGNFTAGLPLMARSFQGSKGYEEAAFTAYQQLSIPVEDVLNLGLGSKRAAHAYLKALLRDGNVPFAEQTWHWLGEREWADDALAVEYVDGLIRTGEFERAFAAWTAHFGGADGDQERPVFNGGFERVTTDGPFDWRIQVQQGVKVSFDERVRSDGTRSVRVAFDGSTNVTSTGLSHAVFLPAGRFLLHAMIKTEAVTTREGVALSISGSGINVTTQARLGTSDWTPVDQEFDVPTGAGMLQISLIRNHSFRFDNQIAGTVWIDDVRITPVAGGTR
jgi:O-antigen ligase